MSFTVAGSLMRDSQPNTSCKGNNSRSVRVPMPLPPEHAETRNIETGERGAHEIRYLPQVFGDDFGPGRTQNAQNPLTESVLICFVRRGEEGRTAAARHTVGPIETHEV